MAEQPGGQLAGVPAGQPAELHPADPADPVQLGQQRAQRVGTVQLVGPVGDHDQQPVQRLLVADQEGQQVPGGPVGPVRVLDDQQHRADLGQLFQQDEDLLEQPGPGLPGVLGRGRLTELGQQPGQLPGRAAGQQVGDTGRAQVPDQLAEHGGERGERQAVRAQLQAAAGQYPGAVAAGPGGELGQQPGFADASLPADQDGRRVTVARLGQRGGQRGQLGGPADQHGTRHAHYHQHASFPRRAGPAAEPAGHPSSAGEPKRIRFPSGSVCDPSRNPYSVGPTGRVWPPMPGRLHSV